MMNIAGLILLFWMPKNFIIILIILNLMWAFWMWLEISRSA